MRITVLLPRRMHFGPRHATSIDLCSRDFLLHSAYRDSTVVLGRPVDEPFDGVNFKPVIGGKSTTSVAEAFADAAAAERPDVVVVHQHVPSAAIIARRLAPVPVLLYRHGMAKPGNWLHRWRHGRMYARMAGVIWVSDKARQNWAAEFPHLASRGVTVHNGLDIGAWHPQAERERVVLCVGRASPEKGILEAAQGVAAALTERDDWRARFILSRQDRADAYFAAVKEALGPLGERAEVLADQSHDAVRAAYESAAIAVVPSIVSEAFGRTAIEAFAGGAALVSSRAGALGEVTGDAAWPLTEVSPLTIAEAVGTLMGNEQLRTTLAAGGQARAMVNYNIQDLAAQLDGIYEQVARQTPARSRKTSGVQLAPSAHVTG